MLILEWEFRCKWKTCQSSEDVSRAANSTSSSSALTAPARMETKTKARGSTCIGPRGRGSRGAAKPLRKQIDKKGTEHDEGPSSRGSAGGVESSVV